MCKPIDVPWFVEILSEKYDKSFLNVMPSPSFVFGGAIRDIFANMKLFGDLDIVIPHNRYEATMAFLRDSPRWSEIDTEPEAFDDTRSNRFSGFLNNRFPELPVKAYDPLPELPVKANRPVSTFSVKNIKVGTVPWEVQTTAVESEGKTTYFRAYAACTRTSTTKQEGGYKGTSIRLESVISYKAPNGTILQIVIAKKPYNTFIGEKEHLISSVIRAVDIICCGVAMDECGRVFEFIPGAIDDCVKRRLRFNNSVMWSVDVKRLRSRIKKLEDRGWKSEINIEKIKKRRNKSRRSRER